MTDSYTPERGVIGALLEAHPGPRSRSEIATILGDPIAAHDAVEALHRDGEVNVEGSLVFADRAAVRTGQLDLESSDSLRGRDRVPAPGRPARRDVGGDS